MRGAFVSADQSVFERREYRWKTRQIESWSSVHQKRKLYGVNFNVTVPSSRSPLASLVAGAFGGHSNGIFSSSRPPTSRAASMTSWYLPGGSPSSGLPALSNLI